MDSLEQGDLLPNHVWLARAHGWGVLWDPGDERGEGGISDRFEDTSQPKKGFLRQAEPFPLLHPAPTATFRQPVAATPVMEPVRTTGGY